MGKKVNLDPILKVTDYQGDVLYQKQEQLPHQIIDPGVAYIVSSILSDNQARSIEFGTNSPLTIPGQTVSVKTGTSDNKRDNWTIGFTPEFLAAVWVGNNDNSPMSQTLASGITGAAPIWNRIMTYLLTSSQNDPRTKTRRYSRENMLRQTGILCQRNGKYRGLQSDSNSQRSIDGKKMITKKDLRVSRKPRSDPGFEK